MRRRLEFLYPNLCYGSQAENLPALLKDNNFTAADCIVSDLPFTTFSNSLRKQILHCTYASLKPGGILIVFQYTPHLYFSLYHQY